jgi:hypothetical protein
MTTLRVDIASEFVGRKAFFEASKATNNLTKKVVTLGKSLGLALGSAALVSYGKAYVKAFAEDEAATIRLANAVDNLGMSYANPAIAQFITNLELQSGIVDDKLRPALQALLTTTKDLTASQKLLGNAINISRASGIDLATVAQDLANGYVGVTRGLRKYNTGLTQAELKTKSFAEVLAILNKQSDNAANQYMTTLSYKLDVLTVASESAKESIGSGLVDALARAGGGSEVKDAVKAINSITTAINGITLAVGTAVGGMVKLYNLVEKVTTLGGLFDYKRYQKNPSSVGSSVDLIESARSNKAVTKALATQTKATKALTAEQKKQASLKKSSLIFDMEQTQLIAALKGKLTEEEANRVKALLALENENASAAKYYTDLVIKAQDATGQLAMLIRNLPTAKNPFENFNLNPQTMTTSQAVQYASNVTSVTNDATAQALAALASLNGIDTSIPTYTSMAEAKQIIELKLSGEGELTSAIAKSMQQASLSSGNQAYIDRRTGGFGG